MTEFDELISLGHHLFQLRPDKKIPVHRGWQQESLAAERANALGRCGLRLGADDLVIDIDTRHGGVLEALGGWVWSYPIVDTKGGWHVYCKLPPDRHGEKFRHTIYKTLSGWEFKSLGRFVVAPGSPGYSWNLATPGLASAPVVPDSILQLIFKGIPELVAGGAAEWSPGELAAGLDQLDPADFREHDEWFRLMCACHEVTGGLGSEEFIRWSVSDEPYAGHENAVRARWGSLAAGKTGNAGLGTLLELLGGEAPPEVRAKSAAADFGDVVELIPVAEVPETLMEKMTRWYRAVDEDGKLRVYAKRHDDALNRTYWVRYARRDFMEVCKSVMHFPMVQCGQTAKGEDRYEEAAVHWLDHWVKKKAYRGVTFAPEHSGERTPDGKLNLWQGFAVEPAPGSWELLKEMTWEVLCDGDQAAYSYVMDWMARAVQRPWEPGGTALVFRGKKGTGKSTLGRAFTRLFGHHGMHVASQSLLTGRFNLHLRDVCALFADEAFWAGDKQGEGVLKALVTERSLAYEGKGMNAEMGRNCVHLVMASNEDWVVPAGMDGERRFAVFEVAGDVRPKEYWDRLHDELNSGGLEAMLWELQHRDVSGSVFNIPNTRGLVDQKLRSMGIIPTWLYESATNGWDDFGELVQGMYRCGDIHSSYIRFCDNQGTRTRSSETVLGMALRKYLSPLARRRVLLPTMSKQTYMYELPEPDEAVRQIRDLIGWSE